MSEKVRAVGIDPGPMPGIAELHYVDGRLRHVNLMQATPQAALEYLDLVLGTAAVFWPMTIVGVERFVTRGRTQRAGRITLDLVGAVQRIAGEHDVAVLQRTAAQVKHWATDTRLKAVAVPDSAGANLLELSKGMAHARDAARHALFTAVHDGLIHDPLSRKAHA